MTPSQRHGAYAAAASYVMWGIFPLYIKLVAQVPPLEIVAHRSAWSLLFVVALLLGLKRRDWLLQALRSPRTLGVFALSSLLLAGNWLIYVWAVNHDRVLDASLGYFINPLVNVVLGYAVLHERPRPVQWAAVALAACGVVWLALGADHVPVVSLTLALSFAVYGLLRKTAKLGALEGLALETLLQAPLAIGWLLWLAYDGTGHFGQVSRSLDVWLLLAGPFTAVPLLLFAIGARRVTMATLGLLQYLGPSIQFVLGTWLYHEPFSARRAVGFVLIWAALAVYSAESWRVLRRSAAPG